MHFYCNLKKNKTKKKKTCILQFEKELKNKRKKISGLHFTIIIKEPMVIKRLKWRHDSHT